MTVLLKGLKVLDIKTYQCKKCSRFFDSECICTYCLDTRTKLCGQITIQLDMARDFIEWANTTAFCNSGQHIVDRMANHLEEDIKEINNHI